MTTSKRNTRTLIPSFTILISSIIFSLLFEEWLILLMGIPFCLSVYFLFYDFSQSQQERISLDIPISITKLVSLILTVMSILAVACIPSFEQAVLDVWSIPFLNIARYVASVLLVFFLPGFFLLRTIDRRRSIGGCMVLVLSYLLSSFVTFLVGFSILVVGNTISTMGPSSLMVICLSLMIVYFVSSWKESKRSTVNIAKLKSCAVAAAVSVVIFGLLAIMIETLPIKFGDTQRHHGFSLQFLESFPIYGGKLVGYRGGYLFHIILATLFSISGIPSVLAQQGLFVIAIMPVLAFYSIMRKWFTRKDEDEMSVLTLLFSTLLGFGGLFVLVLRYMQPNQSLSTLVNYAVSKTYDIYLRILYLPDTVSPIFYLGLPVLFSLVYLMRHNVQSVRAALIIPLVVVGYMGHQAEVILFTIILFIYTLFLRNRDEPDLGLFVLLGLILVGSLDFIAPSQLYVLSTKTAVSFPFIFSCFMGGAVLIIERWKTNRFFGFNQNTRDTFQIIWKHIKWVFLYSYLFLFVIWFLMLERFNAWAWGGTGFVPFFVLPIRLGSVGLLAIATIFGYLPRILRDRRLSFFLLFIPLGFILEQAANYLPSILVYPSYRFGTLTFIGACVIASYGIIEVLKHGKNNLDISKTRRKGMCVLLSLILITGFLTTSLYYIDRSVHHKKTDLSEESYEALDYIHQHLPRNGSVLTFTDESGDNLENLGGINSVQNAQRWSRHLLDTYNPYTMMYIIASSNVEYVYLTQEDTQVMASNNILGYLIDSFPKEYDNGGIMIRKVPPLNPPGERGDLGLFHIPSPTEPADTVLWNGSSFHDEGAPYRTYGDILNHSWDSQNGTLQGWVVSNQSGNVWSSYSLSGISLNTTRFPVLSLKYKVANIYSWFTIRLENLSGSSLFYKGHLDAQSFAIERCFLPKNQTITRVEIITETTKAASINTTARTYLKYVKLSSLARNWSYEKSEEEWSFYQKYGSIYNWSMTPETGSVEMSLVSNQSGNTWVSYSLPLVMNTSNCLLSFMYRVTTDTTWFTIRLRNINNEVIFYRDHLTSKTFTTKTYQLPNDTVGRIEIIVETTEQSASKSMAKASFSQLSISPLFSERDVIPALLAASLRTDYSAVSIHELSRENANIFLPEFKYILLNTDPGSKIDGILEWVANGGTLIVVNSRGYGYYKQLLTEKNSNGFVSQEDYQFGSIVYVDIYSTSKSEMLSEIRHGDLVDNIRTNALITGEFVYSASTLPVFNSTFNDIRMQGKLGFKSKIAKLEGNITFENFSTPEVDSFSAIEALGDLNLTLESAELKISPEESFLSIESEGPIINGRIALGSQGSLNASYGDASNNRSVKIEGETSILFTAKNLMIKTWQPIMNISGTVTFDCLDVHSALYVPLEGIVQERAHIEGNVVFSTAFITRPMIVVSNFHIEGQVSKLDLPSTPDRSIPWCEVFLSPQNLFVVILLCLAIFLENKHVVKQVFQRFRYLSSLR